eukprot:483232-Pleurochrysis_carterae.AAC.2
MDLALSLASRAQVIPEQGWTKAQAVDSLVRKASAAPTSSPPSLRMVLGGSYRLLRDDEVSWKKAVLMPLVFSVFQSESQDEATEYMLLSTTNIFLEWSPCLPLATSYHPANECSQLPLQLAGWLLAADHRFSTQGDSSHVRLTRKIRKRACVDPFRAHECARGGACAR